MDLEGGAEAGAGAGARQTCECVSSSVAEVVHSIQHLLFYSEECLLFRGECPSGGTPSNILLSISKFTFPSPRLACHLCSKSLPTALLSFQTFSSVLAY